MSNPNHDDKGKFSSGGKSSKKSPAYLAYEKAGKNYDKEYRKEKRAKGFADPHSPGTPLNKASKLLDKAQSDWFKEKR